MYFRHSSKWNQGTSEPDEGYAIMNTFPSVSEQLRQNMETLLQKQLEAKPKQAKSEAEKEKRIDEHRLAVWIEAAASRVKQIQRVSHAIKYSHPDAKGSSLYSAGNPAAGDSCIGTHTVQDVARSDIVCSSAFLTVAKFLCLEVDGTPLWQRAIDKDPCLLAALPGSDAEKQTWVEAFAAIIEPKSGPTSHTLAKQIYWPLPDGSYHLLEPLFPTSLVQQMWEVLREDRFGESSQGAREACRNNKPYPHGYRDWPRLTIQKYGSTKPQNISQLNSERHGEVWLLPSHPPDWQQRRIALPLRVKSVFKMFDRLNALKAQLEAFQNYLTKVQDCNNVRIRQGRARRMKDIIGEVLQYAAALREQPSGWSSNPDCRLPKRQCIWLDPGRARDDADLAARRSSSDWIGDVAADFGIWINAWLKKKHFPVGEAEFRAWRDDFEDNLRAMEGMAS